MDVTSDEFLRSYAWRKLRMAALETHGARCQCCGASAADGAVMNVDHIKPRKTHPNLALNDGNLQVLCDPCNHGKGNWSHKDWRPFAGYFYNANSKRMIAHLWDGADTVCRQWSSNGINRARGEWAVHADLNGKRICNQCRNNSTTRRTSSGDLTGEA